MAHRTRLGRSRGYSREEKLATFACALAIFLLLQLGVESFCAKEVTDFIAETQERQDEMTRATYLSIARKVARGELEFPAFSQSGGGRLRASAPVGFSAGGLPLVFAPAGHDRSGSVRLDELGGVTMVASLNEGVIAWNLVSPYLPPMAPLASTLVDSSMGFPPFERTVFPVVEIPNWGAMHSAAEWDRHYKEMDKSDFVPLPRYDLKALAMPMDSLTHPFTERSVPFITAKLAYSTRYYGAYDLDAGEYSGAHPGIDLKLAFGTPIGAIAGGRVHTVAKDENMGLYVMIEHRVPGGETYYSIYGHLDVVWVQEGEGVRPGQSIGTVGMTGNTTAPHVHLQVDRDTGASPHVRFWPGHVLTAEGADRYTVNPITFIEEHAEGLE